MIFEKIRGRHNEISFLVFKTIIHKKSEIQKYILVTELVTDLLKPKFHSTGSLLSIK